MSRERLLARPEVSEMRQRQLVREDAIREASFMHRNIDDARASENLEMHVDALDTFVEAKKALGTMAARFELSMKPEFQGVSVAEIGATTEAECPVAVDSLKGEYRDLLDQLTRNQSVEKEYERTSRLAGCALQLVDVDPPYAALARTRILTTGRSDGVSFGLGKRMVFAMPGGAWNAVQARSGNTDESQLQIVEQMLDNNDPVIIPIRTAYYRLRHLDLE